jgi:type II secretion system protein J
MGFTLMEILIAVSILVILVGSAMVIFRSVTKSVAKGELQAERYQQARFLFDLMSAEISQSQVSAKAKIYWQGNTSQISFIAVLGQNSEADLTEISYSFDAQNKRVLRRYQKNPDFDFGSMQAEEELAKNAYLLQFNFYDGSAWLESWDSALKDGPQAGKLPKAVKITLTLGSPKAAKQETFYTVITLATSS